MFRHRSGGDLVKMSREALVAALDAHSRWNRSLATEGTQFYAEDLDLSTWDLRGLDFSGVVLLHANFTDADVRGCDFYSAHMPGTVFDGANAEGTSFVKAELDESECRGANSRRANLFRTEWIASVFASADLSDADLRHTSFLCCDLSGARFDRARCEALAVKDAQLDGLSAIDAWGDVMSTPVFVGDRQVEAVSAFNDAGAKVSPFVPPPKGVGR